MASLNEVSSVERSEEESADVTIQQLSLGVGM